MRAATAADYGMQEPHSFVDTMVMNYPTLAVLTFVNGNYIESARIYYGGRWQETFYDPPIPISEDDEIGLRLDGERLLVELTSKAKR